MQKDLHNDEKKESKPTEKDSKIEKLLVNDE